MAFSAGLACGTVLLACSGVFAGLFVYTSTTLAKYTPVYTPIRCVSLGSEMGEMEFDENFVNSTGLAKKACRNPNPFPMVLVQASAESAGQVFLKAESGLKPIGVSQVPETSFPREGAANLTAVLKLSLPLLEAFDLLAADSVQIVAEFRVLAKAQMEYLGQKMWVAQEQDQVCGFEVRMPDEVGNAACASTLDELVIPDFDDTSEVEDTMEMTPEYYEYETRQKNLTFGSILAATFVLSLASGACGARLVRRALRASGREEAREAKVKEPEAQQPQQAEGELASEEQGQKQEA